MKCLFISIAFPPKSDPECLQTAKYFYFLAQKEDLVIDVLTSALPTLNMPKDKYLEKYDVGWQNKWQISIPENKYINFIIRKFWPFGIDFPDSKYFFHLKWKKALKLIKSSPEIIYSRSFPISSAIMGYRLASHFKVPWIMHLSDPWEYSPLHNYSGYKLKWHRKWQEKCFSLASFVCFTSPQTIALYTKKYPKYKNKYKYYPNVYDDNELKIFNEIFPHSKLKIVYTGGLINKRSIEWLIPVFEKIHEIDSDADSNFEFIFAGQMDRRNRQLFKNNTFSFVKHIGPVSYTNSLDLQKSADILLLIDDPFKNSDDALFFPSKLLDYFIARKRILAITSKNSTSEKILETKNADIFTHSESVNIFKSIKYSFEKLNSGDKSYFEGSPLPNEFSAKYNVERLSCLFKTLVKSKKNSII